MNSDNMNDSLQGKDDNPLLSDVPVASLDSESKSDPLSVEQYVSLAKDTDRENGGSSVDFDELSETTFWELKLPVSMVDDTGLHNNLLPPSFQEVQGPELVLESDADSNEHIEGSESDHSSASVKDQSFTIRPKSTDTEVFPNGQRKKGSGSFAASKDSDSGSHTKDLVRDSTEKDGFLGSASINKNLSNAPSSLDASITLGNQYRLLERAGKGKMGEVWKAYDIVGNRVVALKFIPRNIEGYRYAVLKAKSTFKATHDITHQYICPTHSLLEDPNFGYFLVMKWIPDNLKQTLEQNRKNDPSSKLPLPIIKSILFDLADALDYLHDHNVIHRDIKPANIAVMRKKDESFESVSLIDFGLAVSLDYKGPADSFYQLSGTPSYMPPEQWKNELQGPQSDQYAFAVVAYELFAGHRIFTAKNMRDLEMLVLYSVPSPIEHLPAKINNALLKALSKKPEDRFPTCRAFVEAMFPPKQPLVFWKNWLFWTVCVLAFMFVFLVDLPFRKKANFLDHQKLQLYDNVLKPNKIDSLGFSLDKSNRVIPHFRPLEVPPSLSQKSLRIDNKNFPLIEDHKEKNWTWIWSEATNSGTLTLNDYKGESISVRGVSVDLVLPEGSKNEINSPNMDALFVDGNLTIRANRKTSLSLNGGLWCRGQFTFSDQTDVKNTGAEDRPSLSINGKIIDDFVDSAEKLNVALNVESCRKTILITNSFESGKVDETNYKGLAGFTVLPRCNITFLSSGNHRILKGKETSVLYPLLRVAGNLEIGAKGGMGSSSLTFDGGSVFSDDDKTAYPNVYSMKMICVSVDRSKVFRFYPHVLKQTSKSALVTVYGFLKFHHGTFFQNCVNTNYFDDMSRVIASSQRHVGGIYVDGSGKMEMTGGAVRNCQGPLCGAVNAYGEFKMSGGLIEDNCSYNGGNNVVEAGGIRVSGAYFEMSGGEIINNFALANANVVSTDRCAKGGGIHGSFGAKILLSGGKVRGNISLWAGGGIYMGGKGDSNLIISNNTVISDNAAALGGGIYTTSNIDASDGLIESNLLLAKISSMSPRGEGIYIKEWNSPETQGRGPVLTISGNFTIAPNNPIFIGSNVALGPLPGPCVFVPIHVSGTLSDPAQDFRISMGAAGSANDNTIRIIQFNGKDFKRKKEDLQSQFAKFHFGYLGFTENTGFEFKPLPVSENEKAHHPNKAENVLPEYIMNLNEK